jgi:hypothetical protein
MSYRNTSLGKRTLCNRSCYFSPFQGKAERMRRVGQILRGQIKTDEPISEATMAAYIDYTTRKAVGQPLHGYARPEGLPVQTVSDTGVLNPGDDYDGLMDVQVLSEE